MSEILIFQLINFILQITFDLIVKIWNNSCTDGDDFGILKSFMVMITGSSYKLLYYFVCSIILLSIFHRKSFTTNLVIQIIALIPYVYIFHYIQYLGC